MADVKLVGRLGRDVVTFNNDDGSKTHILNVARQRNYPDRNGEYGADFIQVKAFTQSDKAHAFYAKHMVKGRLVSLEGNFSSNTYEKNGETVYSVDVIVDDINPFLERKSFQPTSKSDAQVNAQATQQPAQTQQTAQPVQPAPQTQQVPTQPAYQQQPVGNVAPQQPQGNVPSPFDVI